jgi:Protein of unknown function (DUF1566)/IPTL-CTERM motif
MFRLQRAQRWAASAFLFAASFHAASHAVAQNCWDTDKPDSRYSLAGPAGTVVDTTNNLMWKQCLEGQSGADCATGVPTGVLWDDGNSAATASLWGGYSDWRMPTRLEYQTLKPAGCTGLTLNGSVFPNDPAMPIWIGETHTIPRLAWVVTRGGSFTGTDRATVRNAYRLVRNGPPPTPQTLTFGPAPFLSLGGNATGPFTVKATNGNGAVAHSGNAIRYSSVTPAICTVDAASGVVTLANTVTGGSTCTLAADQYGGINNGVTYSPAVQVTQDITVAQNCWDGDKPDAQYSLAGPPGTVVDTVNNLMWRQCVQGQSGVGCTGAPSVLTWAAGRDAATASTEGGYNDWRVPTRVELESLLSATCAPSQVNETRFPNTPGRVNWTSELFATDPTQAWYVGFALTQNTANTGFIRLVRSGQPGVLAPTAQTLAFGPAPVLGFGGTATVRAANTAANNGMPDSGNPVRYSSNTPWVCTVDAGTGRVALAGGAAVGNTCTLAADQYGRLNGGVNGPVNYAPAAPVTQDLVVVKGTQSLAFTRPLPTPAVGNGGTLGATASSGLTGIAYASTTPTVCTVGAASGVITILSPGTCTLTADLALSSHYNAAPQISQDFTIAPVLGSAAVPFTGTTMPPAGAGAGAPASATFTSATGGPTCRFDAANTAFVASTVPFPLDGSTQPHGAFKFKLIGCTPGFSAQITVTWPSLAGMGVMKYGKATGLASSPSFYRMPGLAIVGNSTVYTVTDGQLGDDDWVTDGVIIDPLVPVTLPIAPVPTLGQWGWVLLAGLLAALTLWRSGSLRAQRRFAQCAIFACLLTSLLLINEQTFYEYIAEIR